MGFRVGCCAGDAHMQPISVAQQLISWLNEQLARKSPRTRESYAYVVRRFFGIVGDVEIADLRQKHFRAFYAAVEAQGCKANTLKTFDNSLRAIFTRIERNGKADWALPRNWRSPLNDVERERGADVEKQPLSKEQLDDLLAAHPRRGFIARRNYALLSFLIMTGARASEAAHATVTLLDLDKRVLLLQRTKGNKPRVVYLSSRLVRVLSSYLRSRPADTDLLFPTRTSHVLTRHQINRIVRLACKRAKVPVVGPHRLRHSYITHSLNDQAPLKFVQTQVGHSNVRTTMVYAHIPPEAGVQMADQYNPLKSSK